MNPDYSDIVSKAGAPLWWDEAGVPRYVPFHPKECGVYASHVALMTVHCQCCRKPFTVASSANIGNTSRYAYYPNKEATDPWDQVGAFHYQDPPRHNGCTGDSMNTIPVEIHQFWSETRTDEGWVRVAEYEFAMVPDEL